jgi:hypothetical protein
MDTIHIKVLTNPVIVDIPTFCVAFDITAHGDPITAVLIGDDMARGMYQSIHAGDRLLVKGHMKEAQHIGYDKVLVITGINELPKGRQLKFVA